MWIKALVLMLIMSLAGAVSAQTATPTLPPGCSGGFYVQIGNDRFGSGYTCSTPNPDDPNYKEPSIDAGSKTDLYKQMATAAAISNDLPEQIKNAGPSGQSLADASAGAAQLMGYVKWMFSPASAQELLGKSLAPIGINVMVIFLMVVALVTIYILINLAVYLVKAAIWFINQILKFIPFW